MLTDDQLRDKALEAVASVDPTHPAGLLIPAVKALRDATRTDDWVIGLREAKGFVEWAIANPPGKLSPLAAALKAEFGEGALHQIMILAEHPARRDDDVLQRLRKAAIEAADCQDCTATRR